MTERLITLPLAKVRIHPDNPRLAAAADAELIDSIRVHGLIDPPLCAPDPDDPDGGLLLDGHRRQDGAIQAGLREITVRMRDDLVTTAQQIEVMAITGLQKELLSPVEEARAYEQLQLLGMDEATIAKSTGFTKKRVHQRLRLAGLSQKAQHSVHLGQATLGDVEAFDEFADDPAAVAELEAAIGTDDYRFTVNRLRSRRERAARYAELVAGFEEQGAKRIDLESGSRYSTLSAWGWRDTPFATPNGHDGCLGYVDQGPDSYADPYLACSDPDRHRDTDADEEAEKEAAAREAERQAAEAERTAQAERQKAAGKAREDWLVKHFTGLFPVKGNGHLAESLTGVLPAMLGDTRMADLLTDWVAATGAAQPDPNSWEAQHKAVMTAALDLTVGKPAQVLGALGRLLGVWIAGRLAESYVEDDELPVVLWMWDWLAASGYPMSAVDVARHQELAARAAENDDGDEA